MWPYHPSLLATPVPRYTSFPTAAELTPDVTAQDLADAIAGADGDVSLYLHIPFCERICWYCGCNTGAANRRQRLASYLDALHQEIELVGSLLPSTARVRRIAFGGGSPNACRPDEFVRLVDALAAHLPLSRPTVSVELDPRSLGEEWGRALSAAGATHASLGVQTFAPHLQAAIGRVQPIETIGRSVALLRCAGITSLNFDLMYGLPGQTEDDLHETLDLAAPMGPDRIALFGYAHVPHLIPRQRQIDGSALPGQEARFQMAALGYGQLVDVGYQPVGFDHFALPGDQLAQAAMSGRLRRNFQGFTDDQAPVLIGLGASAVSSFPDILVQNEKNSGRYRMMLSQNHLAPAMARRRTGDDQRRGAIIEGLLCAGRARVNAQQLHPAFDRLAPFMQAGLCAMQGEELVLTAAALPYARSIAAAFDPYRQDSTRRFSSAV